MTLSTIRTGILSHFLNNDVFLLSDASKIKVTTELEKMKSGLINEAMKDLETNKIVKRLTDDEGVLRGWILESKLGSHGQEVYLSLPISNAISETINTFFDAHNIKEEKSNPLNLSERDIGALLGIINDLLDSDTDKDDE